MWMIAVSVQNIRVIYSCAEPRFRMVARFGDDQYRAMKLSISQPGTRSFLKSTVFFVSMADVEIPSPDFMGFRKKRKNR